MPLCADTDVRGIDLLVYPGAQQAAVHGLTDLFGVANGIAAEHATAGLPRLRVRHWQVDASDAGLSCCFDSHPGEVGQATVIVLPPCLVDLPSDAIIASLADWLREQHGRGVTLGSVCAGAFLLAHSGLLDGRIATTHWHLARELAEQFPAIEVDADRLIIDDGDIITAGGLMAWTDLGLALVNRLLGPSVAAQTARFLVVDLSRHSQRYFSSFAPSFSHGDEAVLKVQHWLQTQVAQGVSLADMAARAGLGERTFLRRFRVATGLKPTEYAQHLRMGKARELLELTQRSVEQIAWEVGYQDPGAFRQVFLKVVGLMPRDYRQRFAIGANRSAG